MLAGVGGRTVAEAKQRLSWQEYLHWLDWRRRHGPLHLQHHLEYGAATVAHTVACTIPRKQGSKGPRFEDFLPQRSAPAEDAPISLEKAMELWR